MKLQTRKPHVENIMRGEGDFELGVGCSTQRNDPVKVRIMAKSLQDLKCPLIFILPKVFHNMQEQYTKNVNNGFNTQILPDLFFSIHNLW